MVPPTPPQADLLEQEIPKPEFGTLTYDVLNRLSGQLELAKAHIAAQDAAFEAQRQQIALLRARVKELETVKAVADDVVTRKRG